MRDRVDEDIETEIGEVQTFVACGRDRGAEFGFVEIRAPQACDRGVHRLLKIRLRGSELGFLLLHRLVENRPVGGRKLPAHHAQEAARRRVRRRHLEASPGMDADEADEDRVEPKRGDQETGCKTPAGCEREYHRENPYNAKPWPSEVMSKIIVSTPGASSTPLSDSGP